MKLERGVAEIITVLSLIAMLCFCMIALGHAETTKARPNSLGVPEIVTNPYTYMIGLPLDGQVLEGKATNIRVQPLGAPLLYDVDILFCGDVSSAFQDKHGVLAIAYRMQASRMYQGVPCNELKSVFELK